MSASWMSAIQSLYRFSHGECLNSENLDALLPESGFAFPDHNRAWRSQRGKIHAAGKHKPSTANPSADRLKTQGSKHTENVAQHLLFHSIHKNAVFA